MVSNKSKQRRLRLKWWLPALLVAIATPSTALAAGTYDASFESRYNNFSDRQTLNSFSNTAISAGQYDQALSTLEQIIFEEPNDIEARISIARLFYHVGSFDLALGHVNEALALGQGSSFELEIIALKKLIEKAASGVRTYLDLTIGADYRTVETDFSIFGVPGSSSSSGWSGFAAIDGVVEFDLGTATRDNLKISGGAAYDRVFGDFDFDTNFEYVDLASGYGAVSLSKGLPDIIDTLRLDVSGYGEIAEEGNDRIRRELGVQSRISVRPTVETLLYADFKYAWLGSSTELFVDNDYEYGVGFQHRVAPGWTAAAYVSRTHREGLVPANFIFASDFAYDVASTNVEASLTHLLFVFDDGRSWFQRLSASYSEGEVLDYRTVDFFLPNTTDRRQWQINWDHTVQTSTNGQVQFGAGYKHAIINEDGFNETKSNTFTVRALYTHRFQ